MIGLLGEHLVRRALDHTKAVQFVKRTVQDGPKVEMPGWGIAIIVATFIASAIFIQLVEYTLEKVIATLCMIETPSAAITVSASDEPAPKGLKESALESGPTITLVNQKPITSSIRGTIRHLVSRAGRLARFRGFRTNVIYSVCAMVVMNILDGIFPRVPGRLIFISGLTAASLANLHASWTHKIISMPTNKSFWQQVPARSNWKILALPAAIKAVMPMVSIYITQGLVLISRLDRVNPPQSGWQWASIIIRIVSIFAISLICILFLTLPAEVTLKRIEASILPEDQDTIVPFDRSFDGKVVPKILGGTGSIGFVDAWKSFNWEARRRLIKLYVKIFFIITGLFLILFHVIAFEAFAIMGPKLGKWVSEAKHQW